ncbi:MAG: NRDE family protein [Deltaproteobacteria bacterium]|nr:NRDE family protein [Deltaproteobacteria bacterium]
MCLIIFAYKYHPLYPLVFGANRDEFYERPSAPVAFWDEEPNIIAGRDLRGGGTWLGLTKSGRIAAITNFRDPLARKEDAPSRGILVSDFLRGDERPEEFIKRIRPTASEYNGFNIIVGDLSRLFYFSNRGNVIREIDEGIHGLSNHLLDTPWPKVERGKEMFARLLSDRESPSEEAIFDALADTAWPDDTLLPDTGVGMELERILSPIFIKSPGYGTRSSTVILIDSYDTVRFTERTFDAGKVDQETRTVELKNEKISRNKPRVLSCRRH